MDSLVIEISMHFEGSIPQGLIEQPESKELTDHELELQNFHQEEHKEKR